ncbi:hypothetical protein E2320_019580 [Naja naja]|nr:hypothetical protein E2320_019580 [Naja naja]
MDPTLLGHRPPGSRNSWALESEPSGFQQLQPHGKPRRYGHRQQQGGQGGHLQPAAALAESRTRQRQTQRPLSAGPGGRREGGVHQGCGRTAQLLPSLQLEQPDSDSELLDQVLEECEENVPRLLPIAAPRRSSCRGSGDCCSRPAEGVGGEIVGQREAAEGFLTRSTSGSNNFANQLPLNKPERQAKISYDCSEEELMATIEQEYCR